MGLQIKPYLWMFFVLFFNVFRSFASSFFIVLFCFFSFSFLVFLSI